MVTPDIETSTREERLEFIREEFKCLGNFPICGKCNFLRGREAEDLYADYIEGHRSFRDITVEHRNWPPFPDLTARRWTRLSPRFLGDAGLTPCIPTV